jgi:hypothetical protein
MTLIKYKDWNPKAETLNLVQRCAEIIQEYMDQGYTLTVRQLYYRLVSKDMIPNSVQSYNRIVSMLTKARMAGLISWESIEDRNREHHTFWTQESEQKVIDQLPYHIRFDRWARQEVYVEVWVEKEALGNVIERACRPWMVPHMACKGYLSASEAWRAGRRFRQKIQEGKECHLIHLGDHDPSGIDMTRDNKDRVDIFSGFQSLVEVDRVALNMDQVDEYSPPPNPAKKEDSRYKEYRREFGSSCWELDALEPSVIEELVTNNIECLIDFNSWDEVGEEEAEVERVLGLLSSQWDDIRMDLIEGDEES